MNHLKKSTCLITVCFFCLSLLFTLSCASTPPNKFQQKIQKMSDDELTSYYHGINARIKDIDNDLNRRAHQNQNEQERMVSNMPFIVGGHGYDLVQKRKKILTEMDRRKITP